MNSARRPDPSLRVTDYLVIGSGIAGLRAAITLGRGGRVILVNKGRPPESASKYAQGGIAVALDPADSVASHREDTLIAGQGLCRNEAVGILVGEGPERVRELIAWGARFDEQNGRYLLAREAGHRFPRILRAHGDATGTEIVRALSQKAATCPTILRLDNLLAIDLLMDEGRCVGAVFLSESGSPLVIGAKAVVLATGGAGQAFARTTNPPVATADGMAMAYRAGATLEDMEFMQFHPTALALPQAPAFLMTEAMRGEGAVLRNANGEAFMKRYHRDGDLATRDVVSRAIWQEMRSTQTAHVYLDITGLRPAFVRERFPTIYQTCLGYGLDITKTPAPVAPSAHFMIGGVRTSVSCATSVPRLYAAGEVASSGVHGANRLASNSLLEGLVFGARAAEAVLSSSVEPIHPEDLRSLAEPRLLKIHAESSQGQRPGRESIRSLQETMWDRVGIVRDRDSLTTALKALELWETQSQGPVHSILEGEFKNLVTVSRLMARAALLRKGSIGVHTRSDEDEGIREPEHRHIAFQRPDQEEGYFTVATR